MNTANYVDEQITGWKQAGWTNQAIAWNTAMLCVGWPYVYGAWGAYCTTAERKKRYSSSHPTIYSACQVLRSSNPKKNCDGCKWYPDDQRVRCFDCRGFTDWILNRVGIDLIGEGCTSQWNTASNWSKKGKVADGIPANTLVCLFYPEKNNAKKMAHTGLGLNGETIECSSGVQYNKKMDKKWVYWAVPAGIEVGPIPDPPKPEPETDRPTIRKGSTGKYVTELQKDLIQLGYDVGSKGADGKFGAQTEAAVKAFQKDHDDPDGKALKIDGVVGKKTWAAIEAAIKGEPKPAEETYIVTIPKLTKGQAEKLCKEWGGATMKKG